MGLNESYRFPGIRPRAAAYFPTLKATSGIGVIAQFVLLATDEFDHQYPSKNNP